MPSGPVSIETLLATFDGRSIPNCPGRYVLGGGRTQMPPSRIVGDGFRETVHESTSARDTVVITWIEDWGLISYHRADGSWCHTVNEPRGFQRKLKELDIVDTEVVRPPF
jgi:hypothetical protein